MRKMTIRIETHPDAYTPSTKNIAVPLIIEPANAVCQLKKWNEGLKLGADPIFSRKHAKFITKKVIKYVIVVNDAI